jgi:hypothetical protein
MHPDRAQGRLMESEYAAENAADYIEKVENI